MFQSFQNATKQANQAIGPGAWRNITGPQVSRDVSAATQRMAAQMRRDAERLKEGLAPKKGDSSFGLRYSSIGRFAQSAFIRGFGGGIVGGLVGVFGYGLIQSIARIGSRVGHEFARFFSESLEEGIKLTRLQISLRFLAQDAQRATSWLQQMFQLSAGSGFGIAQLGSSFQTIAGQASDIEQVPSIMRAITEISSGLGADAEKMNRLALAIGQVMAAGRFEGQEILQLTETIPIKHFAETAGISIREFRERMREGTLDVKILTDTLNRLALTPGGAFFGRMDEMAKSAVGQVMKLNQNIMLLKASIGMGLLEELKDQNVLSALNQGFEFLLTHKDETRNFLKEMVGFFKELSFVTARWAGIIYDVFQFMYRNLPTIGAGIKVVLGPLAYIADEIRKRTYSGPFKSDTGDMLVAELKKLYAMDFTPTAQGQVRPLETRTFKEGPTFPLSKEAEDFVKGFKGSSNAAADFQKNLKLIDEAETFHANEFNRKRDKLMEDIIQGNRLIQDKATAERGQNLIDAAQRGLKDLGPNQFGAQDAAFARAEAFLTMEESLDRMANEFPKAMERGSVEAQATINKALFSSGQMNLQERVAKGVEQANKKAEERKKLLESINKEIKNLKGQPGMAIGP